MKYFLMPHTNFLSDVTHNAGPILAELLCQAMCNIKDDSGDFRRLKRFQETKEVGLRTVLTIRSGEGVRVRVETKWGEARHWGGGGSLGEKGVK